MTRDICLDHRRDEGIGKIHSLRRFRLVVNFLQRNLIFRQDKNEPNINQENDEAVSNLGVRGLRGV